jgi:hypothetical protein
MRGENHLHIHIVFAACGWHCFVIIRTHGKNKLRVIKLVRARSQVKLKHYAQFIDRSSAANLRLAFVAQREKSENIAFRPRAADTNSAAPL